MPYLGTRSGTKQIIVISGHVGSGKTTLSRFVAKYLRQHGFTVCYDRVTAFPLVSYLLFKVLALLMYGGKVVRYHESLSVHPSTLVVLRLKKQLGLLKIIIIFLESICTYLRITWLIFKCRNKDIVIIDEGFANVLANYIEILGETSRYLIYTVGKTILLLNKTHRLHVFYLKATCELLVERWFKRGYPKRTSLVSIHYHLKYSELLDLAKRIITTISNLEIVELNAFEKPVVLTDLIVRRV